jgi:MoaA/NifB/PqqE/SkfB family radical SAM enzyme
MVCACSYDPKEKFVLGDLNYQSFKDIWEGPTYCNLRRQFRKGWEKLLLCGDCSYAYEGGNCYNQTVAEAFFFNPESHSQRNL